MKSQKQKITPLLYDTYCAMVKNSMGARTFRNVYACVDGKKKDITKNSRRSCAFFVSSILLSSTSVLHAVKLICEIHITVGSTVKDLALSGWKHVRTLKRGSILVWEKDRDGYPHIGFYVGNNKAISYSSNKKTPVMHHFTYGVKNGKPVRKIEAIYWHKKLSSKK
ncbi:hypothetical protein HY839_01115 [Candidatus Azambacteria bacterium]|nr:hypothetical protein [Candidatus Azambacteria bacterium]